MLNLSSLFLSYNLEKKPVKKKVVKEGNRSNSKTLKEKTNERYKAAMLNKDWMCTFQVAGALGHDSRTSSNNTLHRLYEDGLVEKKSALVGNNTVPTNFWRWKSLK